MLPQRVIEVAVDLDDERRPGSEEVDDSVAYDLLSAKLDPETPAAKGGPQERLRVGQMEAHVARTLLEEKLPGW